MIVGTLFVDAWLLRTVPDFVVRLGLPISPIWLVMRNATLHTFYFALPYFMGVYRWIPSYSAVFELMFDLSTLCSTSAAPRLVFLRLGTTDAIVQAEHGACDTTPRNLVRNGCLHMWFQSVYINLGNFTHMCIPDRQTCWASWWHLSANHGLTTIRPSVAQLSSPQCSPYHMIV